MVEYTVDEKSENRILSIKFDDLKCPNISKMTFWYEMYVTYVIMPTEVCINVNTKRRSFVISLRLERYLKTGKKDCLFEIRDPLYTDDFSDEDRIKCIKIVKQNIDFIEKKIHQFKELVCLYKGL